MNQYSGRRRGGEEIERIFKPTMAVVRVKGARAPETTAARPVGGEVRTLIGRLGYDKVHTKLS